MTDENVMTIINNTGDNTLRIAVFQKAEQPTTKEVVAWRVVAPAAGGGKAFVEVPDTYTVDVLSANNGVKYESNPCTFSSYSANLILKAIADDNASDQKTYALMLDAQANQADPQGHITVEVARDVAQDVKVQLLKDGTLVLPPVMTNPGDIADFIITPTFYLAVVEQITKPGSLLSARTINSTLTPIQPGQRAIVTEDTQGYHMSVS